MNSHHGVFPTLFFCIEEVNSIGVADEEGGNFGIDPVPVIFHDDDGLVSWIVVVDDDEVSSQVLGVDNFFREFAGSPLDQVYLFKSGVLSVDRCLSLSGAKLVVGGHEDLPHDGLAVGNLPEVGKGVFYAFGVLGLGELGFGALGAVDLEGGAGEDCQGEDSYNFEHINYEMWVLSI